MNNLVLASVSINQTPMDWKGNTSRIVSAINEARYKANIISFPELCISGYGLEDFHNSISTIDKSMKCLLEIVDASRDVVVSVGLPIMFEHGVYNAACLIADGEILGFACKQSLAGDGVHYEPRFFKPWPAGKRAFTKVPGKFGSLPVGDCYFGIDGVNIGYEICEEAWTADRGSRLAGKVDVILNPSASHFSRGKYDTRLKVVQENARSLGVAYVYSPLVGNEAGKIIYDGGSIIATPSGIVSTGPRFSYNDYDITYASCDIKTNRLSHSKIYSFNPNSELITKLPPITLSSFNFPERGKPVEEIRNNSYSDFEEFTYAVCLGLFDYLRKSKLNGFVVSLSGGADSSLVSCLVFYMVMLAGYNSLRTKLSYITGLSKLLDFISISGTTLVINFSVAPDITKHLLTTVYQQTSNSSSATYAAAKGLSDCIGAKFISVDLGDVVDKFESILVSALSRTIDWVGDSITRQNIQARARNPIPWAIANAENRLFLTTSNRSEASVGYCSLDGDTAGCLAPISGVSKDFIRGWLRYICTGGIYIERLQHTVSIEKPILTVLDLPSSAELIPDGINTQKDEEELMPFDILTEIEIAAIRDKQPPIEVLNRIKSKYKYKYTYTTMQLASFVEKFYRLWARNQYKREKLPRGFHLDDISDDPTGWTRFPMLSAGFEEEIGDMLNSLKSKAYGE